MSDLEDSFGWCSDHSKRDEMSDSDDNDFMTHPEVNSYAIKKEKIEQYLSLEENISQSTGTDKRKKKVKSDFAIAYDDEVQDGNNPINNELFQKKKHKKRFRDAEINFNGVNENNIKVEKETNNITSEGTKIDCPENYDTFNVTNEESSRKKKKKKRKEEIPLAEDDIYLSNDGIKSEFPPKKKKKKRHDTEKQISVQNENFTEELNNTSIKKTKKKRKDIEEIDEGEMTTDRARNLLRNDSFHYESSDSNEKKNITSQHKLKKNLIEADDVSVVGSTTIKEESTKKKKKKDKDSKIQLDCNSNDSNVKKEKPEKKIKRERNYSTSSDTSNSFKQRLGDNHQSLVLSETKIDETTLPNEITDNKKDSENNNKNSSDDESSHNTQRYRAESEDNERRKSVSEKNQFEDDNSESAGVSEHESINSELNQYNNKKFRKVLEHFKTFKIDKQSFDPKLQIDPSHDLFLLKCPINLNVSQLVGTSMATNGKSKIKIEDKIYECIFENNEEQYRTIISTGKKSGEYRLQRIKTQGQMRLRRKLPKPNVANHTAAVKPNTFMLMPDTKRRHPLFGIEYKPMIKINKQVAERLQEAQTIAYTNIIRKKKKVKPELTDLDISIKKNKKRKRKVSDSESISEVASKKVKLDPGKSEEIWDSEKHIAQSLFADL